MRCSEPGGGVAVAIHASLVRRVAELGALGVVTMDRDTFQNLVQVIQRIHAESSEIASFVLPLLLLASVIGGVFVARWIFRGGLSRSGSLFYRS